VNAARSGVLAAAVMVLAAVTPSPAWSQRSAPPSSFVPLDSLHAPAALAPPVTLNVVNTPLRDAVSALAVQLTIGIAFDPAAAGMERMVSVRANGVSAARTLLRLLDGSGVQAMVSPTGSIVLVVRATSEGVKPMVSGVVSSGTEPLWGARVSLADTRFESSSDAAGHFTLGNVPRGDYTLRVYRIGFAPVARPLHIDDGIAVASIDVAMTPAAVPVAAVIVTPGYFGVLQPGLATAQTLTRSQIETVPQLGEDAYRAIGRLPGVATSDLSAQFAVRGEPSDALYVTLDGLPLFEPYHLKDLGNALSIIDLSSVGSAEHADHGGHQSDQLQTLGAGRICGRKGWLARGRSSGVSRPGIQACRNCGLVESEVQRRAGQGDVRLTALWAAGGARAACW
jgi:hypothetical protein